MSKTNTDSVISFYQSNSDEGKLVDNVFQPIIDEALHRGYNVQRNANYTDSSEVGIYTEHDAAKKPINSNLAIYLFHGIDDSIKKNYYIMEDYSQFDVGLLPGQQAANIWNSISWSPRARPNKGMYVTGWPKSDYLSSSDFESNVNELLDSLKITGGETVLYAPTLESDNKVIDFVNSAAPVFQNCLIKGAPYETAEYDDIDLLDKYDIHVIDKNTSILEVLSLSDVVVSDQSSVLLEAILTDTIPISVTDWPIRWGDNPTYPGESLPAFAIQTSRRDLQKTLQNVVKQKQAIQNDLREKKDSYFAHIGSSSTATVNLIDSMLDGKHDPDHKISPDPTKWGFTTYLIKYHLKDLLRLN